MPFSPFLCLKPWLRAVAAGGALALPELLRVLPYRWYFPLVHRMTGL